MKQGGFFAGLFSDQQKESLRKNALLTLLVLIALAMAFIAVVTTRSEAQEGYRGFKHDEYHALYQDWTVPGTQDSCCSNMDCRRAPAEWVPNISGQEGHWVARVDGIWKRVPSTTILDVPSPDGAAHVCADEDGYILCFRPPVAQAWLPNYKGLPTLALFLDSNLKAPVLLSTGAFCLEFYVL